MTTDELLELERTALRFPAVPSEWVLRAVRHIRKLENRMMDTQGSLIRIIHQLHECRDTEAAMLRLVTESQERQVFLTSKNSPLE